MTGQTAWSALVLAGYVVGLSYVAKGETTGGVRRWWPLAGLALPLLLAAFMNPPAEWFEPRVLAPVLLLVLWCARSVSYLFRSGPEGARNTVSGLLAGIALVDLVAMMPPPFPWGVTFLALMAGALLLQRVAPAT